MKSTEQSSGRRLGVLTIDQAIAGASNVLMLVLAARVLPVASFGLFSIVFLTYGLIQGVARALVGDPMLMHSAEAEERAGDAIGASTILGFGLAVFVLVGGVVAHIWDSRLGDAFLVLAVCIPLLILQDLGRYLGFAMQRPARALVLDVVWLVLVLAGTGVLILTDSDRLWVFIAVWAGSGAAAGLIMLWQLRTSRIRLSLDWLRETWSDSWRYLAAYTAAGGSALLTAVLTTAIAGAKAMGGIQGALLLQRPFVVFQIASMASGVVEVSRSSKQSADVIRMGTRISALTTAVAVVNGVILLMLPDALGEGLLGDTWSEAHPLLLASAAQIAMMGMMSGARSGLLGLRAVKLALRIDITKTVLIIVLTVVGVLINGALGGMWAVAIGHGIGAIIWWAALLFHLRTGVPPEPATELENEPVIDPSRGLS
ncbi:hypothetical protein GCM10022234_12740 [Aeromicrobium panaciterrae]|uniref:hypothetical protein n=1 Tax=Aeromicrobium panaciterrae TaxID=363861 RepID=UPI0031D8AC40